MDKNKKNGKNSEAPDGGISMCDQLRPAEDEIFRYAGEMMNRNLSALEDVPQVANQGDHVILPLQFKAVKKSIIAPNDQKRNKFYEHEPCFGIVVSSQVYAKGTLLYVADNMDPKWVTMWQKIKLFVYDTRSFLYVVHSFQSREHLIKYHDQIEW